MAARHRLEAAKARTDMREWQVKRRERTRQLIELGGLVVKAGLVELADDRRNRINAKITMNKTMQRWALKIRWECL